MLIENLQESQGNEKVEDTWFEDNKKGSGGWNAEVGRKKSGEISTRKDIEIPSVTDDAEWMRG